MDQNEEHVTKKIQNNSLIQIKTDPEFQSETNLIFNLDKWLKKAKSSLENQSHLSYLPKIQRKKEKSEIELEKKELMEEEILKKYNNQEHEILTKKVQKKEDYEIQAFFKKMPQISKISTVFFENEEKKTDETNEQFIERLKKNIKILLRADVSKGNVLETAQFFEKHVDKLMEKIEHKIKNIDAILVTKETTMQLIRKENLNIIKRINKIKQMVIKN